MTKDQSMVQVPRELFGDAILPQNADELAQFMDQPTAAIAESLTGAFAAGPKAWMLMTGRIVQGMLKGKLFQQVAREIKDLRNKGKIPDDFADEKKYRYGFKSWVELLSIIDEETPDADRLEALKAAFYAVNKLNATDGEKIVAYQLFRIAKELTSGQVLYLKACDELRRACKHEELIRGPGVTRSSAGNFVAPQVWFKEIGTILGHDYLELLERDDLALIEFGLLTPRGYQDRRINADNAHLSALGLWLCTNIETYRIDIASPET